MNGVAFAKAAPFIFVIIGFMPPVVFCGSAEPRGDSGPPHDCMFKVE